MADLALLQPDARVSARLTAALDGDHRLVSVGSWEAMRELIDVGAVEGCLVDALHPNRADAERSMREARARDPYLALVAYLDAGRSDRFYDLGELGVDGLVTSATRRRRFRNEVDQAFAVARARRVAAATGERFDEPGPSALAWAVVHATGETSVERMARSLGSSPRRLREGLATVGLPVPARLLLWGRLLLAGARLADDDRSVEAVAFSLRYATSSSLARAMKQQTGCTPREVAEGGGMRRVLKELFSRGRRRTRGRRLRQTVWLALAASAGACASLGGGGVDGGGVERVLAAPEIATMHVGVLAVDAETGRTLFEHNADRKFIPASNQKVLVTATALTMLGPEYRFQTELWGAGAVEDHTLRGDLVLVASGDPSLSGRFWPSGTAALDALADSLREAGVRRVDGRLVVDVSAWDSTTIGPTWEFEDLRYRYASTGGAFAIDEGEVEVVMTAPDRVGGPVAVTWSPVGTHGFIRSHLVTVPADSGSRVRPSYLPESRRVALEGTVEQGTVDTLSIAVRDPVREAAAALAAALERAGVEVEGGWTVRWTSDGQVGRAVGGGHGCVRMPPMTCPASRRLAGLASPPLSELVAGVLGPSQNWMTEQLLRALGERFGETGSWSEGVEVMEAFLVEHVGVDSLHVSARDGSGLSAYNLVTPRALTRVLRFMHLGPHAEAYTAALAEPGEEDSTLERRLPDLEGRVFAKTGTISNVNSLSGYLVRENGRVVVFSVLTNGSGLPASRVRAAIDDIVRAIDGRSASE